MSPVLSVKSFVIVNKVITSIIIMSLIVNMFCEAEVEIVTKTFYTICPWPDQKNI